MSPTPRWIDRARTDSTVARVIQTLIDAGEDPATARRLVIKAVNDCSRAVRGHAKETAR